MAPFRQEYSIGSIRINHQKTVGTGSCAGCSTPACITFRSAEIYSGTPPPLPPPVTLTAPVGSPDATVTWQGGFGVPGCFAAVPTRGSTWGMVKSLYR